MFYYVLDNLRHKTAEGAKVTMIIIYGKLLQKNVVN